MRQERLFWAGITLTILAYLLPWAANNASGLSLGAYDLAEFLSKAPFYDSRIYYPVLALRGQLVFITALIVFGAKRPFLTGDWWLRAILGILLIIAQLPALNMLPSIGTDLNRQQQMILAGISFFALVLGLSGILARWQMWTSLVLGLGMLGTSLYGVWNALEILRPYGLNPTWGIGFLMYLCLGLYPVIMLFLSSRRFLVSQS